jgi:segregation and condensation protein B
LRDLSELPPRREFKELGEAEQAMLPVGDDPVVVGGDEAVGADASLSDTLSPEPAEHT